MTRTVAGLSPEALKYITKLGRCKNKNIPEPSGLLWFELEKHGTKIKYELGPAVT
jgi:hypothetical protein